MYTVSPRNTFSIFIFLNINVSTTPINNEIIKADMTDINPFPKLNPENSRLNKYMPIVERPNHESTELIAFTLTTDEATTNTTHIPEIA